MSSLNGYGSAQGLRSCELCSRTGRACNFQRPCLLCIAYSAECVYTTEAAPQQPPPILHPPPRHNGRDAEGERYARHLLKLVENTLPAIQSVGFQRLPASDSPGTSPTYHPVDGVQPLRRLSHDTNRVRKQPLSPRSPHSSPSASRRTSLAPRVSFAERQIKQSEIPSNRSAPPSITTRLSFPSCTYGSTRARERWKYESSFEHLVGESRPPHEVSYDSRLARAKAATWQIKCLSDDQFRALIHWYLAWDHPSNPLFDEEHLLNALDSGSNERCNLVLMHMVLAFATKSYNLRHPIVAMPSTELEIMNALQDLWTDAVNSANAANIAAHTLLHALTAVNGDDEPGAGFLTSAMQMAEHLDHGYHRHGQYALHSSESWAIWAAYCEAMLSNGKESWIGGPPRTSIPDLGRDRDHKLWSPPFQNGPSRASLGLSIFRNRCSLATVASGIAAYRLDEEEGSINVTAVLEIQERLTKWHTNLPFPLQNLHNATPQHLLLLAQYHEMTIELLAPVVQSTSSLPSPDFAPRPSLATDLSSSISVLSTLIFSYDRQYPSDPIPFGFLSPLALLCNLAIHALVGTGLIIDDPVFHLRLTAGMIGRMVKAFPVAGQRLSELRATADAWGVAEAKEVFIN